MTQRPIIFFDLETTGVSTSHDRIIQIGAIKVLPDGTEEVKNVLINPTIPIPAGASAIHGVYDKDVAKSPTFHQISKSFAGWLSGSDLAGYNSDNFDVPMLMAEFDRVGISFPEPETKLVDVYKIERMVNGHTLGDTYKRYMGEELDGVNGPSESVLSPLDGKHMEIIGDIRAWRGPETMHAMPEALAACVAPVQRAVNLAASQLLRRASGVIHIFHDVNLSCCRPARGRTLRHQPKGGENTRGGTIRQLRPESEATELL